MIDAVQILLIIVITILTTVMTIIGIEVFKVLKKLRQSLTKINNMLEDLKKVGHMISEPVEEASTFLAGLKRGIKAFKSISELFKNGAE